MFLVNLHSKLRQRDSNPALVAAGAIARAFSIEPEMLLLDEPLSALDELRARRLRTLMRGMWLKAPSAALLATHYMLGAAFLADGSTLYRQEVFCFDGGILQNIEKASPDLYNWEIR